MLWHHVPTLSHMPHILPDIQLLLLLTTTPAIPLHTPHPPKNRLEALRAEQHTLCACLPYSQTYKPLVLLTTYPADHLPYPFIPPPHTHTGLRGCVQSSTPCVRALRRCSQRLRV